MESGVLLLLAFRRQLSIGFTAPLGDLSDQLLGQLGIIWKRMVPVLTSQSFSSAAKWATASSPGYRFVFGCFGCLIFVDTGGYRKGAAADFCASAAAPSFFSVYAFRSYRAVRTFSMKSLVSTNSNESPDSSLILYT